MNKENLNQIHLRSNTMIIVHKYNVKWKKNLQMLKYNNSQQNQLNAISLNNKKGKWSAHVQYSKYHTIDRPLEFSQSIITLEH